MLIFCPRRSVEDLFGVSACDFFCLGCLSRAGFRSVSLSPMYLMHPMRFMIFSPVDQIIGKAARFSRSEFIPDLCLGELC
jgi:hypothetical protein